MVIFFQELILMLFLWMLRMIDGLMEIFSAISGITDVSYQGTRVNIIEFLVSNSTVGTIFWCIFILAVGLTCIFAIVALVKNMIANNRNITSIMGKFFLALLGTMAMLVVVYLGILISNAVLQLVSEIFQISNTTRLSNALFNACVGDWLNGYSISEIDITSFSVGDIFGDYKTAALGIWPKSWKMDGMVNPQTFLYLPALVASIALLFALILAVLNLAKRVYEIIFMFLVMPLSASTISLDDGARFKAWREMFVTKVILAYGTVFAVNIFILLLPLITKMQIDGVSNFANKLFLIFMIVGGAMVIPAGQTMFARLFGQADDMRAGGGFFHSALHGGRVAGAMTVGMAMKMLKGGVGLGKKAFAKRSSSQGQSDSTTSESSDQYKEPESGTSENSNQYNETNSSTSESSNQYTEANSATSANSNQYNESNSSASDSSNQYNESNSNTSESSNQYTESNSAASESSNQYKESNSAALVKPNQHKETDSATSVKSAQYKEQNSSISEDSNEYKEPDTVTDSQIEELNASESTDSNEGGETG